MHRELLLMRHAKSDWASGAPGDFDRPLAARGRRDAPRMGRWLAREGLLPDHVVSSPAARARETVLAVLDELPGPALPVHWEPRIYEAGYAVLLGVLGEIPIEPRRVLFVGHNPGLEDLLCHLAGGAFPSGAKADKLLPTGALACLDMPCDWRSLAPGSARCRRVMRPKDL